MRSRISLNAFTVLGFVTAGGFGLAVAPTAAMEVDISAGPTGNGCTVCFGGPLVLNPGETVTLENEGVGPLQRTLGPGTYSITNAATSGNFSAWRYDGGSSDWAWNFVIGSDNGDNTANVVDVGWVAAPFPSQNEVADATGVATYRFDTVLDPDGSTAGYSDTLTLTTDDDPGFLRRRRISERQRRRRSARDGSGRRGLRPRLNRRLGLCCFSASLDWPSRATADAGAAYDFRDKRLALASAKLNRAR